MRNFERYPRRDPIKNYFPLPNEIFLLGLSAGEIAVYAYLLYREDRKTFRCYPSYKTIGKAIGVSRNTVKFCLFRCIAEILPPYILALTKEAKTFSCAMKMNIVPLRKDFLSSASMGAKKNPQIS